VHANGSPSSAKALTMRMKTWHSQEMYMHTFMRTWKNHACHIMRTGRDPSTPRSVHAVQRSDFESIKKLSMQPKNLIQAEWPLPLNGQSLTKEQPHTLNRNNFGAHRGPGCVLAPSVLRPAPPGVPHMHYRRCEGALQRWGIFHRYVLLSTSQLKLVCV
jgi:hypothetical protein